MNIKALTDLEEIAQTENMIAPAALKVAVRGLKELREALVPFARCQRPWIDTTKAAFRPGEPTCKHIKDAKLCDGCVAARALDVEPV